MTKCPPRTRVLISRLQAWLGNCPSVCARWEPFAHVDFSAAMLEMDFIHERSHQLNSPLITGYLAVHNGGVQEGSRVKALSFIPDDDGYFLAWSAPAADVNLFLGILLVSVTDGIVQCSSQGKFNVPVVSRNAIRSSDEMKEFFDHSSDSC